MKIIYLYRNITDIPLVFSVCFSITALHCYVKNNSSILKHRIDFPKEVVRKESLFTNIIVDETTSRPENHCDDAVIYMSDTVEPGNQLQTIIFVLLFTDETHNFKT